MKLSYRLSIIGFLIAAFSLYNLPVKAGGSKLYVVTDQERYAPGETMQFQVFLMYASDFTNNTVFAELLDCKGNLVTRKLLPATKNTAWGAMELPVAAPGEYFLLYCYVTDNRNNVECYTTKKLFKKDAASSEGLNAGDLHVSIACEGNSFVAECPTRVLAHCTDAAGRPVETSGELLNQKDEILTELATNREGYVRLLFSPQAGDSYYIRLTGKDGKISKTAFPPVAASGATLGVVVSDTGFVYSVYSYTQNDKELDYNIQVLHYADTVYNASLSFAKGLGTVSENIPLKDLPRDFLCFRLLTAQGKVAAQRVIYNGPGKKQGQLVRIIDTINRKEASVLLPEYVSGTGYLNIAMTGDDNTGLPLSGEQAYLDNDNTGSVSFNDRLWTLASLPSDYYRKDTVNRFLALEGALYYSDKKPVKNKPVNLFIIQKNLKKDFLVTSTDNNGRLRISNLVFYDSAAIYYQLGDKSEDKNNVSLQLDVTPGRSDAFDRWLIPHLSCNPAAAAAPIVQDSSSAWKKFVPGTKTLQEVTVTGTLDPKEADSKKFEDKHVSGQFNSKNFMRSEFDFIKEPQLIDNTPLFTFLRGRMAGLFVGIKRDGTPLLMGTGGDVVSIYLNDMALDPMDLSPAADLTVKDVALVRFYSMSLAPKTITRSRAGGVMSASGGDLMIYTRRDFTPSGPATKGMAKTTVSGYSSGYQPTLLQPAGSPSLYWKAGFDPVKESTIYLQLPANATESGIRIIIEGINTLMAPYRFTQRLVFM